MTDAATRPPLTSALTAEEFQRWYWLREELAAFCRAERLPRSGSKADLTATIVSRLGGAAAPVRRRSATVPDEQPLDLDARIPGTVRCDQRLRDWFTGQIGPGFRFTVPFQRWLHDHAGRPYSEAVAAWWELSAQTSRPIASQFEYNAFTRSFRAEHPGCSAADVREAWWEHRSRPRDSVAGSPAPVRGRAPA